MICLFHAAMKKSIIHCRPFTVLSDQRGSDKYNFVQLMLGKCDWNRDLKKTCLIWRMEGSPRSLCPREEKSPSETLLLLSYTCNSKNQLSELCLLPWSRDRNHPGGEREDDGPHHHHHHWLLLPANPPHLVPPHCFNPHLILFISCLL